MATPTLSEIGAFIQEMKNGKKIIITGEGDPDPYGGGAHWDYEMYYRAEMQIFVLKTNFYASQYNSEPEISYTEFDEVKAIKHLLQEQAHKISCW
jgi:hypothetical protein